MEDIDLRINAIKRDIERKQKELVFAEQAKEFCKEYPNYAKDKDVTVCYYVMDSRGNRAYYVVDGECPYKEVNYISYSHVNVAVVNGNEYKIVSSGKTAEEAIYNFSRWQEEK